MPAHALTAAEQAAADQAAAEAQVISPADADQAYADRLGPEADADQAYADEHRRRLRAASPTR